MNLILGRAFALASLTVCLVSQLASAETLASANLRTEWLAEPMGIDVTEPRLSWQVKSSERGQKQTAYHIVVASSEEKLLQNRGDLWDTGKVASGEDAESCLCGHAADAPTKRVFWKVQVWDKDGASSKWSQPASWSMGLLKPEDWKAQWISFKDSSPVHNDHNQLFLPPAHNYRRGSS